MALKFKPTRKHRKNNSETKSTRNLLVRDLGFRSILPKGGYKFHSDYYEYGERFGRILTLIESDQADRNLDPFWRVFLIPQSATLNDRLGETNENAVFNASGQLFEIVENKSQAWTTKKQSESDDSVEGQASSAKGNDAEASATTRYQDNRIIAQDRAGGDAYAITEYKVLITADSLSDLDTACARYNEFISTRFDSIRFEVYQGQVSKDLTNILCSGREQLGQHPMATSSEYSGGYDILTRGITDVNGDYIGRMIGDVNNTAVLMDVDNYDNRVVIAHSSKPSMLGVDDSEFDIGTKASTLLAVRLAQAALINNHRVIHLVLNDAKPQNIGANLDDITTVVSLNGGIRAGAINLFEIFGDKDDLHSHYSSYSSNVEKIRLMVKELAPSVDDVDLNEVLTDAINNYYEDRNMLVSNPKENWEKLRLVGLPHDQYPRLSLFIAYLDDMQHTASRSGDMVKSSRLERVRSAFKRMKSDNDDLFDVQTDDTIDSVNSSPQVIYDFSSLKRRGTDVAMAQFINAIGFAIDSLSDGDVIFLHGVSFLNDSVKSYVSDLFDELKQRQVRVVFLYDDLEKCLIDYKFNGLINSDWSMLGGFNKALINQYQKIIQKPLAKGLEQSILDYGDGQYGDSIYYLSRKTDNVLFALDMDLGQRNGGLLSENPKKLIRF